MTEYTVKRCQILLITEDARMCRFNISAGKVKVHFYFKVYSAVMVNMLSCLYQ